MFPVPRQHLYASLQIDPEAVRDFRDHKMPDEWPYILLQKAFQAPLQQEQAAGHADIVLLQEVLPAWDKRSHYRLNILTMTCIECKGPDPSQWIVRVHRYQTAREIAGLKHEIQAVADVGGTSQMNFLEWSRMHPKAAVTIAPSVETMKGSRK